MIGTRLRKSMTKTACMILKNTWGAPPQLDRQLELVASVYGFAAIEADFEQWCESVKADSPRYPISEYLKHIDERLGGRREQSKPSASPEAERVGILAYRLTNKIPSTSSVQSLLSDFPESEITAAFSEYVASLGPSQRSWAVKMFFIDGQGRIVLLARRERFVAPPAKPAPRVYSNDELNRWKREIDAADVIGSRVALREDGQESTGLCPFHEEKTPSFKVYRLDDGVWVYKCFGCGKNGNVFQFVSWFDKVPFPEAVKRVLEFAEIGEVESESVLDFVRRIRIALEKGDVDFSLTTEEGNLAYMAVHVREALRQLKLVERYLDLKSDRQDETARVKEQTAANGASHSEQPC